MRLNRRLGYDPAEPVCARLFRERRLRLCFLLDVLAFLVWFELAHCRKVSERHVNGDYQ